MSANLLLFSDYFGGSAAGLGDFDGNGVPNALVGHFGTTTAGVGEAPPTVTGWRRMIFKAPPTTGWRRISVRA